MTISSAALRRECQSVSPDSESDSELSAGGITRSGYSRWKRHMKSTLELLDGAFGRRRRNESDQSGNGFRISEAELPSGELSLRLPVSVHVGASETTGRLSSASFEASSVSGNTIIGLEQSESRLCIDAGLSTKHKPLVIPNRFQLIEEVGRGGFGIVYHAFDTLLAREVALKVPHLHVTENDELSKRFIQESRAAARLNHPNIVRVMEAREFGSQLYQVSEFVPGERLSDVLSQCGRFEFRNAASIVCQLASAVHHAHTQGVIHRDIKPDNILLERLPDECVDRRSEGTSELFPRLTDFGLAYLQDCSNVSTQAGVVVGTPKYMAPEQLLGKGDGHRASVDIFALGLLLYELMTGMSPYEGISTIPARAAASLRAISFPVSCRSNVPLDLMAVCLKCLEVQPEKRYPTANDLRKDLQLFLEGRPTVARPISSFERMVRWSLSNPVLSLLLSALTVCVVVILVQARVQILNFQERQATLEATNSELNQEKLTSAVRLKQSRILSDTLLEETKKYRDLSWKTGLREAYHSWNDGRMFEAEQRLGSLASEHFGAEARPEWQILHSEIASRFRRIQDRHVGLSEVRSVPGSSMVAVVGNDGQVSLYHSDAEKPVRTIKTGIPAIHALAVSRDGQAIAVGGVKPAGESSSSVRLFNIHDGRLLESWSDEMNTVESLCFNGTGDSLVVGCRYQPVLIINLKTGGRRRVFGETRNNWISCDAGGQWLAFQNTRKSVCFVDTVDPGKLPRVIMGRSDIDLCEWIPGTDLLAIAEEKNSQRVIRLIRANTLEEWCRFSCPARKLLTAIVASDDGRHFFAAVGSGEVFHWTIPETPEVSTVLPRCGILSEGTSGDLPEFPVIQPEVIGAISGGTIRSLCLKNDRLYAAAVDGGLSVVSIHDLCRTAGSLGEIHENGDPPETQKCRFVRSHLSVDCRKISLGGRMGDFYETAVPPEPIGENDAKLCSETEISVKSESAFRRGDREEILAISSSADGRCVAWGNSQGGLMFRRDDGQPLLISESKACDSEPDNAIIQSVALDHCGDWVAWTCLGKSLHLSSTDAHRPHHTVISIGGWGRVVAFSDDGRTLICGGHFGHLVLLETSTGIVTKVPTADAYCEDIEIHASADGSRIISCFSDGAIRCHAMDGRFIWGQVQHDSPVINLTTSGDGTIGVSVDSNRQISIWQTSDGQCLGTFDGDSSGLKQVRHSLNRASEQDVEHEPDLRFTPDDHELLLTKSSADGELVIRRWSVLRHSKKSAGAFSRL